MTDTEGAVARPAEISTPTDREIVTERVFDAPRARVYAAFTDPELIPQWWGLKRSTTIVDEMDLRPGGAWRFVEHTPEGDQHAFRGTYREVNAPELLEYSFEWEGMPGHVCVETVTFEDLGGQTRVRTVTLFHTTEERDGMLESGMEKGLNESYASLDELLAREA
jgi:uncharacterized protein YndB with AHSA1/START domain